MSSSPSAGVSDTTGGPKEQTLYGQAPESFLKCQPLSEISRCKNPPCFPSGVRFLLYIVYCKNREQEYTYTCLEEERITLNERPSYELKIKEM